MCGGGAEGLRHAHRQTSARSPPFPPFRRATPQPTVTNPSHSKRPSEETMAAAAARTKRRSDTE